MIFKDLVQLEMEERKNIKDKEVSFSNKNINLNDGLKEIIGQSCIDKLERYNINYDYIFNSKDEWYNWEDEKRDIIGSIDILEGTDVKDEYYYDEYIEAWVINGQEIEDKELINILNKRKYEKEGDIDY